MTSIKPVVKKVNDTIQGLNEFQNLLKDSSEKERDIILQFPTVYIHNWKDSGMYDVYIGESNNIIQRTKEHFDKASIKDNWQYTLLNSKDANLYVIGHEYFNKSMTLDIENRLMHYMMSVDCVRKIHNMRSNPQHRYFPDEEMDSIFHMIWRKLRKDNKDLFPLESKIKDSAVYKASPLHKLTRDQEEIKKSILQRVFEVLNDTEEHQIIFVEGEAGTGKTVLNSSTFYEMFVCAESIGLETLSCCMMVNHDEQITVYQQIAQKLGLTDKYGQVICKPTSFINRTRKEEPIDIAFIDEAHLLLTQGKQSYRGKNQLKDIVERAKVTVVMFDENQILTTEQYWESEVLEYYRKISKKQNNYFELKEQLRMQASAEVINWIDSFTKNRKVEKIPKGCGEYVIRVFDSPEELESAIKEKALDDKHKLSRMIATYDWSYGEKRKGHIEKYCVKIGNWYKPWNRELNKELDKKTKCKNKSLSWAEQPQTIDEIGSTFTIQGFDLNYAGVILGPSVKYRNGEIIFDPTESCHDKAVRYRTLSDGTKMKFGETLIQHQVRVLMTRGVEGLYIYACDDTLRQALFDSAK